MNSAKGKFVFVVGPSGAGKDTLLDGASQALSGNCKFVFPKRHITRPADAGGEDHIATTAEAFDKSKQSGQFALDWEAHGLLYGIPQTVTNDLAEGRIVIANGSRGVIDRAREQFDRVRIVYITAPREVLRQRLKARGRENEDQISGRIERDKPVELSASDIFIITNDQSVREGVGRLVALFQSFANE